MIHPALSTLLSLFLLAAPAAADDLWGVTATDLVVVDSGDPSQVTVVGPHRLNDPPSYLAHDSAGVRLFGLRSSELQPPPDIILDYELVEYDLCSGFGAELHLGTSDVIGVIEALEYVESLGSLVVSRSIPPDLSTTSFATLDPESGALDTLVDVGFDNDFGAYDDVRDLFYVWDSNDTGRIQIVDLVTGQVTDVGAVGGEDRDGAFSEAEGGLFYVDGGLPRLFTIGTTDGLGPITRTNLGTIAGDPLLGIAFLPEVACPCLPVMGCVESGQATISVVEKKPGNEKLKLTLKKIAEPTVQADFGNPVTAASRYGACLYDQEAALVAALHVRGGGACGANDKPCWKAKGDKGYAYKDPGQASFGVKKITVGSGAAGKGKIILQAGNKEKKDQSEMPVRIAAAFEGDSAVFAQIHVSDGLCYEAKLNDVKKNDAVQFKAKGTGGIVFVP